MKNFNHFSLFYILGIILMLILYYNFFKINISKEPIFYLYNNKIIYAEEAYKNLILKKIKKITQLQGDKIIIETGDQSQYLLNKKVYNIEDFIRLFYIPILLSIIALLFSIWFYEMFQDIFFSIFFLLKSIFIFVSLLGIYYFNHVYHDIYFTLWSLISILFINSYINLNIRFLGKSINTFVLLIETIVISIVFLFLIINGIPKKEEFLFELMYQSFILIFIIFMLINLFRLLREDLDKIDKLKIISFMIGNFIGFIPILLFFYIYTMNLITYLFLFSIYPFFIAYSLYRMYLVPNQLIVTKTLVTGFITIFFIILYFTIIYIYANYFAYEFKNLRIFYDIFFLILLSIIIDPIRIKIYKYVKNKILIPEKHYIFSLIRLSKILARISRPNVAIEYFLKEVETTLEVEKCLFLFPPEIFPNINLNKRNIIEIPKDDPIWHYIKPQKVIATNYIVYSAGNKKRLFNLLITHNILLLFGLKEKESLYYNIYLSVLNLINIIYFAIKKQDLVLYKQYLEKESPNSALLIGKPKNRTKFSLKEIRYLQEVSRLAGMMITNIYTLFKEVDKRKKVRNIIQSGKFQRKLIFHKENFPMGIKIQFFNQPVLSVSGDYVDIIPINNDKIAIFLGDVSGHGLGTGYLVSAIRSIVHYAIQQQMSLKEIISLINIFLNDRYSGYEFLTLFAFTLEISSGRMSFINAAHPGIFIKNKNEPIYKIENTQRLLGISSDDYKVHELKIEPETKIFLFSDGVLETISNKNELFGEERLRHFLDENADLPLEEISKKLLQTLEEFRGSKEFQDDTTFLVIEYNPPKNILEQILRNIFKAFP